VKLKVYHTQLRKLQKLAKTSASKDESNRYRIIICRARGVTVSNIVLTLGVVRSTVTRWIKHYREKGINGLHDRRHNKLPYKVTENYIARLETLIHYSPTQLGWQRSTWTRELLAMQLFTDTGIHCHPTHIGRLLKRSDIRWGRPKPSAKKAVNAEVKDTVNKKIKRLVNSAGADEVVVYQDEVDIDLNPKIGPCWMPKGKQFSVPTPGKNEKRYIFGGLNPHTGHVIWTAAMKKDSNNFIVWLKHLLSSYRRYQVIHVVLDNYIIHKTQKVKAFISNSRIKLHFLPPYSPELNPIERLWGEVHANVTRNHKCETIQALMKRVIFFLRIVAPYPGSKPSLVPQVG
jgi:putative transposase